MNPDLKDWLTTAVMVGYHSKSELRALLQDDFTDELELQEAQEVLSVLWETRCLELDASNSGPDDSDRLAQAFLALRSHGIVCEENFTCCQTCGHAAVREADSSSWGYVFFHEQDSERIPTGQLYLAYSLFDSFLKDLSDEESEDKTLMLAETIVMELEQAGLRVDWAGNVNQRIIVRIADWRRPLDES